MENNQLNNPHKRQDKDTECVPIMLNLNGFFVRSHCEKINKLHDVWYDETCRFIPRDQLTLPFAIWKTRIMPENITNGNLSNSYAIIKYAHG